MPADLNNQAWSTVVTKKGANGKFYTKIVPTAGGEEKATSNPTFISYSDKVKQASVKSFKRKQLVKTNSLPISRLRKAEADQRLIRSKSGDVNRITYDRNFLLLLRDSPLSASVPKDLPEIPGATTPLIKLSRRKRRLGKTLSNMSGVSLTSVTSEETLSDSEVNRVCDLASTLSVS